MKYREMPHSDNRLDEFCLYCGIREPDTNDHVPSKILLDRPFPDHLHMVRSCLECNNGFSLDEQYFACLIECVICGTSDIEKLNRKRIKDILIRQPKLKARLDLAKNESNGNIFFKIEENRVNNVLVKLAKGHTKFENSQPIIEDPSSIWMKPLHMLTIEEENSFFAPLEMDKFPEVGSRALISVTEARLVNSPWITVQPNNYHYMMNFNSGTTVRIIIWEYLAVEVKWNNII
ncbi:hypothetical protein [uncultured Cytophaga sp.]|mgnify:FL=1|uniref:hypothetical protein n=1 Tax=uncultured Cytophaga sp. TaxID=160238 RepID=UPI00261DD698|nr:hypothetical protein [uncultured Cytophaga sp.]